MKTLPVKDKIFWKNFFQYIIIFIFFAFLFSARESDSGGVYFKFSEGYIFMSSLCVLYLGFKISRRFVNYEELEDLRIKKNMTHKEFNEKYEEIIDIYR